VIYLHNNLKKPMGLRYVEAPSFCKQLANRCRLSALRAGRLLTPGKFIVLTFVRDWANLRAIVHLEGLGQLKKSNYVIWNGIREPPASIIVTHINIIYIKNILITWNGVHLAS
jgi:hypothetical protein